MVSAGSFGAGCLGVALAALSGANGFWIFASFFLGSIAGGLILAAVRGLLTPQVVFAGVGLVLAFGVAVWIKNFILSYASHSFPFNWVAGWYYFVGGALLFGLVFLYRFYVWLWAFSPFESKGWNVTVSALLTLVTMAAVFFSSQRLVVHLAEKRILGKLGMVVGVLALGPAAFGIFWFLVSMLINWLRSR